MKPWRKSFGIWVPDRSLRDNRGFISPGIVGAVAGSRRRVAASETFGVTDASAYTTLASDPGLTFYTKKPTYTCPGSGTRRVNSILCWVRSSNGTSFTFRLAIYDDSLNLVGQGVSAISVTSTTLAFAGHTSQSDLKAAGGADGSAINLTGGSNYRMSICVAGATARYGTQSVSSACGYVSADSVTNNFPNPIGAGTNYIYQFAFQVNVT